MPVKSISLIFRSLKLTEGFVLARSPRLPTPLQPVASRAVIASAASMVRIVSSTGASLADPSRGAVTVGAQAGQSQRLRWNQAAIPPPTSSITPSAIG